MSRVKGLSLNASWTLGVALSDREHELKRRGGRRRPYSLAHVRGTRRSVASLRRSGALSKKNRF